MAEYPALPLWTDALIGDTYHLTPAEFGAYLRLLIAAWRTPDCCLPNDDVALGRMVGDPKNWRRLRPVVMPFFTQREDGRWVQKRLQRERDRVSASSRAQSSRSQARWLKNKETGDPHADAGSMPDQSPPNASISISNREESYRRPVDTARELAGDDDDQKTDLEAGPPEPELRALLAAGGIANPTRADLAEASRWIVMGLTPDRVRNVITAVRARAPEPPRIASYFTGEVERLASQPPPPPPAAGAEIEAAALDRAARWLKAGRTALPGMTTHERTAGLIAAGVLAGWDEAITRGCEVDRSRIPRAPRPAAE